MRRLTAVVASGLLVGGVVMASPAAWADHPNGLDDFKLTGEITDFEGDDTGRDGPSEGDTFTIDMDLFDKHGDDAGDGEGTCKATHVDRQKREFTADCEGVFHLDDGDLEMEGEVTEDDFRDRRIVLDITGGTDDYEHADGTVTFTPADDHGKGGHRHAQGGYEAQHAGDHGDGGHGGHGGGDHDRGRGDHDRGRGDHDRGKGDHDRGRGDHDRGRGHHGNHRMDIDVDFD